MIIFLLYFFPGGFSIYREEGKHGVAGAGPSTVELGGRKGALGGEVHVPRGRFLPGGVGFF